MSQTCPFFGRCGGCKYDFAAADYRDRKKSALPDVIGDYSDAIWIAGGTRRRAEFCFAGNKFGFYESGTKNIIPITHCPNIAPEINEIIPKLSALPLNGSGGMLVTLCDNGIDVAITSDVSYFSPEFKSAAGKIGAIRVSWNGHTVFQSTPPRVSFGDISVEYPIGAFLQPSIDGANALRDFVVTHATGKKRVADLFCGLGNFTFALNADGFDITGTGQTRDLFKNPLKPGQLNQYDCVIMDPPRAGAMAQAHELARSNVPRIIYISCNPNTFIRDAKILGNGGYKITQLRPVDQFPGTAHWEIASVFDKE